MNKLSEKLISRKFWLTVGACAVMYSVKAYDSFASIVIAFLAVQAGLDAFQSYTEYRTSTSMLDAGPYGVPDYPTPVAPGQSYPGTDGPAQGGLGWQGALD